MGELRAEEFLEKVFFPSFVTRFADFDFNLDSGATEWTHEMVDFATRLAKRWGFEARIEKQRWDLMWRASTAGRDPVLRFEHENSDDYGTILNTVDEKLVACTQKFPTIRMLVGIVYPKLKKHEDDILEETGKLCKRLPAHCALLLIINSTFYQGRQPGRALTDRQGKKEVYALTGHIFTTSGKTRLAKAKVGYSPLGFYYAYPAGD